MLVSIAPHENLARSELNSLGGFFLGQSFEDRRTLKGVAWKMGRWVDARYLQRSLHEDLRDQGPPVQMERAPSLREGPTDQEQAVQTVRAPSRHWWSFRFRRWRR